MDTNVLIIITISLVVLAVLFMIFGIRKDNKTAQNRGQTIKEAAQATKNSCYVSGNVLYVTNQDADLSKLISINYYDLNRNVQIPKRLYYNSPNAFCGTNDKEGFCTPDGKPFTKFLDHHCFEILIHSNNSVMLTPIEKIVLTPVLKEEAKKHFTHSLDAQNSELDYQGNIRVIKAAINPVADNTLTSFMHGDGRVRPNNDTIKNVMKMYPDMLYCERILKFINGDI